MTIIVFLIDTSASMNQRTFIGARPTMLDIAKGAVETFVKLRQRSPESRGDRYMLFTFEDPPVHIKAGWKENLATFMNELKNIKATGLSTLGPAIKNVYDVLNINRMQSGIDTYGTGRSPFFLEPSVIITITDGGKLSSSAGVQDDIFPLPKVNPIPGAELTKEVFRWDQRLFGLVLRLTGTPAPDPMGLVPSDNSPLDKLCEQTGGRSYAVRSHRMFQQCIDSLVQKVQSGVVINFEKIGPDPPPVNSDGKEASDIIEVDKENQANNSESISGGSGGMLGSMLQNGSRPQTPNSIPPPLPPNPPSNAWHNCRKMIYVPRPAQRGSPSGFWPIPESFWPDVNTLSLPARSAHPNVKFTCTSQEPMVIDNLPFDKYELEPSPLTQYILSRRQPTTCWQVYIPNSSKNSDVGHPFGYLKASTTLQCVNLFVMPYNYPILLPLLDDLFKTHRLKPTKEWRIQFDNYLRSMPPYYANPLKRALSRMGAPNLVPDNLDNSLSYQVTNHLKRLKNQAKMEYERICLEVEKRLAQNQTVVHEGIRIQPRRPLSRHLTSNHTLQDKLSTLRDQVTEYPNFAVAVREGEVNPQLYRNPFDIPRYTILDQLTRMRANFLQCSMSHLLTDRDHDQLHMRPISQMGNYQDYLKKQTPPLREIESAPTRQHMFGNPFKIDKKMSMMVDEADDLMGAGNSAGGGRGSKRPAESPSLLRPNKRRRGPLPIDISLRSIRTPSPPGSPAAHRLQDERLDSPRPDTPGMERADSPPPSPMYPGVGFSPSPSPPSYPPSSFMSVSPPASPAASPAASVEDRIPPIQVESPHLFHNGDVSPAPPTMREEDINPLGLDLDPEFPMPPSSPPSTPPRSPPPSSPPRFGGESPGELTIDLDDHRAVPVPVLIQDTASTRSYNKELVLQCFKEVKRPGRDFTRLFEKLNTVQGSYESRLKMVKDVIHEAGRFKRHSLVKLLTQFMDSMINAEKSLNSVVRPPPHLRVNGHSR
ncbi:unnamed protein product, partial [Meganyctiphanes norvegica]